MSEAEWSAFMWEIMRVLMAASLEVDEGSLGDAIVCVEMEDAANGMRTLWTSFDYVIIALAFTSRKNVP